MKEQPRYISQAVMSRRFNVTRACFANWIVRYPTNSEFLPTPEPDAFIDGKGIWLEDSWWKWQAWKHRMDLAKLRRYSIDVSPELLAELSGGETQMQYEARLE